MGEIRVSPPEFVIPSDNPDSEYIRQFEQSLRSNPQAYLEALSIAGRHPGGELEGREPDNTEVILSKAVARLNQYFDYRYDRSFDFDPETKESLNQDETLLAKLREFKESKNPATSEMLRDEIRQLRLRHFVGQIILWQNSQEKDTRHLPSAV